MCNGIVICFLDISLSFILTILLPRRCWLLCLLWGSVAAKVHLSPSGPKTPIWHSPPPSAWVREMSSNETQELPWSVSSHERRRKPELCIYPSHMLDALQNYPLHSSRKCCQTGHCQFTAEQLTQAAKEIGRDREWSAWAEKKAHSILF